MIAVSALFILQVAGCGKKSPPLSLFPLVNKEDLDRGRILYNNRCMFCHGAPAKGNPPRFEPMVSKPVVAGDPQALAMEILYYKGHELKPGGPCLFEMMDDADIARIGNYVRDCAGIKEVPLRGKMVLRAREIHAAETGRPIRPKLEEVQPAPSDPQAKSLDRLPEPEGK
jgi:cytochrome c553